MGKGTKAKVSRGAAAITGPKSLAEPPKPRPEPEWPEHFPPGCPPPEAEALGGTVYYLVATDPPTEADMKCAIDRNVYRDKPQCLRAALSTAREREHLEETRGAVPRLRKHLIASGDMGADHGKIMQTGGPGHYSMWLRAKHLKIGHTLFKVVPT